MGTEMPVTQLCPLHLPLHARPWSAFPLRLLGGDRRLPSRGAWAASQCPPPKNVWKLPLGRCQELCTDWQVGQGRCSCRQVLENSSRPVASRC